MTQTAELDFHGIYPMLYAFFRADNTLDREAFRRQVSACIASGVHGLAVGGLASECNKLSTQEKRTLLEWTLEDAAGRLPVSVTVSENTLLGQRQALAHAREVGAAWAVLQPPPVRGASAAALVDFFAAVAEDAGLPLAIQNAPDYIGIGLDNAGMLDLARRAPAIAILKAEGPAPYIGRLLEDVGQHFAVFNGRNGVELIDNLRSGCVGTIPGVECCDRQARIYDLWRSGSNAAATEEFRRVLPLLSFLMLSIDHLLCYGKRLAARRLGLESVHDRGPAVAPQAVDLETLEFWSRDLEPLAEA